MAEHELPPETVEPLRRLLEALADPLAPTTVHDPSEGVDVHVADSFAGLVVSALRSAATVADLGAGAGLPGLVLAAARREATVHLVESTERKCEFIAATADAMGLTNARVEVSRAEEWRDGIEACDAVTARALAALPVILEYAAPLLRVGGVLVAWKGQVEAAEARDAAFAAQALGLEPVEVRAVTPFPGSTHRTLHVYRKVAATPDRYPRRAGMAAKRPLTAK